MLIQLPVRSSFDKVLHGDEGDITSVLGPKKCLHTSSGSLPNPCPGLDFSGQYCSLLKLKQKAVMSCGPLCGSFVFVDSPTSGRRKDRPLGYALRRAYVRMANVNLDESLLLSCTAVGNIIDDNLYPPSVSWLRITARMVLFWFIATVHWVFVVGEQPGSSVMPYIFPLPVLIPATYHGVMAKIEETIIQ